MSSPKPDPVRPQDPEVSPTAPDPLLQSGSFIDPDQPAFEPGTVIAAQPISMVAPDGTDATPRAPVMRRSLEEMAKRPNWLPEDWKIDLKVRTSGASAGLIDRYYYPPSGQRKFRSKTEVLRYLDTESNPKQKLDTEADAGPSGNQKQKKSSVKRKKSEAVNSDTNHSPHVVSSEKSPVSPKQKKSSVKGKKSEAINSDTNHTPHVVSSETSPVSPKQKKSSMKGKKSEAVKSDINDSPHALNNESRQEI
ncbi:hypothetical protein ACJIZ3_017398 [Penstemon smallii]|uniref:MBD domain-containing protein n=1 Tax=Penstemon smallii TaxID=265156 RepID=A0ABD3SW69_9LAMI